jgi:protein SCO1/2
MTTHGITRTAARQLWGALCAFALCGPVWPADSYPFQGFVDDRGSSLSAEAPSSSLTLLTFGYTSCPDVCPLTLQAVHQALVSLGPDADRLSVYFVTVDSERDDTARLHQYVGAFDDRIRALRGSDAALQSLTARLHVRYWRESLYPDSTDYVMSHTSTLFLLDPRHRVLARIPHEDRPDLLARAIVRAVRKVERR